MKISVITATFNSAATLPDTLASVVAQTYPDVEHIIVDGASTDSTLTIVEHYRSAYERGGKTLRVVSERDRGIYDAMNKGISMATGTLVGLLNSDDYFTSPDVLARVLMPSAPTPRPIPVSMPSMATFTTSTSIRPLAWCVTTAQLSSVPG